MSIQIISDGRAVDESTARNGSGSDHDSRSAAGAGIEIGPGDGSASGLDWGAGSGTDGSGSGGDGKRKRGRPRKRDGNGSVSSGPAGSGGAEAESGQSRESTSWEAPKLVGAKKRGRKKKGKFTAANATKFVSFAYSVPATIGYGDHWRLDDEEAKNLGAKLHDVVSGMEGTNPYLEKVMEIVGTVGPWISLVGTAAMITLPRVALTKAMMDAPQVPDDEPGPINLDASQNGTQHAAYSRMGL